MKIYQIWYETSVGPAFSTERKALAYIRSASEYYNLETCQYETFTARTIGELRKQTLRHGGYPDVEVIELDDNTFSRDR